MDASPTVASSKPILLGLAFPGKSRKAERRKALLRNLRESTFILPRRDPVALARRGPRCGGGHRRGHGHAPLSLSPPRLRGRVGKGALASRRSTTALAAATERHRSARATRLPRTGSERATPMVRKIARIALAARGIRRDCDNGSRGHYPLLAVPAQRDCTRRPVMMPAGRVLPKPPERGGDEPPPAGAALAPPDAFTRPASL